MLINWRQTLTTNIILRFSIEVNNENIYYIVLI
jgi:hypothetical protein